MSGLLKMWLAPRQARYAGVLVSGLVLSVAAVSLSAVAASGAPVLYASRLYHVDMASILTVHITVPAQPLHTCDWQLVGQTANRDYQSFEQENATVNNASGLSFTPKTMPDDGHDEVDYFTAVSISRTHREAAVMGKRRFLPRYKMAPPTARRHSCSCRSPHWPELLTNRVQRPRKRCSALSTRGGRTLHG